MCMGGGGGGRATITMPDTKAYDRQFDLQRAAIEQQMNNSSQLMQQQLQASLQKKNDLLTQIKEIKTEKATNTQALEEQAMRLSTLIGPPPPQESAKAPAIGSRDRNVKTTKGKKALRIGRSTSGSFGQGAGLNIT